MKRTPFYRIAMPSFICVLLLMMVVAQPRSANASQTSASATMEILGAFVPVEDYWAGAVGEVWPGSYDLEEVWSPTSANASVAVDGLAGSEADASGMAPLTEDLGGTVSALAKAVDPETAWSKGCSGNEHIRNQTLDDVTVRVEHNLNIDLDGGDEGEASLAIRFTRLSTSGEQLLLTPQNGWEFYREWIDVEAGAYRDWLVRGLGGTGPLTLVDADVTTWTISMPELDGSYLYQLSGFADPVDTNAELFPIIPEPATGTLLLMVAAVLGRRRFRQAP